MKSNMKKYIKSLLLVPVMVAIAWGCGDSWLEKDRPMGQLTDAQAGTKRGAEQLLIGTYAILDGISGQGDAWMGAGSNWVYGSVVGGDAYKGSTSGDQADINPIARFEANATNGYFNRKWQAVYAGVSRANATIRFINLLTEEDISAADKTSLLAQARFLRGYYHFEAKKMWNNIPFIDETITYSDDNYDVANDVDAWPRITEDLRFAYESFPEGALPAPYNEIGRVNRYSAGAVLGKALLYQKDFAGAKVVFDDVITKGVDPTGEPYALAPQFHMNFEIANENGNGYPGNESVFAVQASRSSGIHQDANYDQILNFPNGGPTSGGCCGFFQPTFELANSFRTGDDGLPVPKEQYNGPLALVHDYEVEAGAAFTPDQGNLDPRLDWTVGRRGIPYLDWGVHPGVPWIRDYKNGGPYTPVKNVYSKAASDAKLGGGGSWGEAVSALNYNIVRFADVLLMAAEAEIEVGTAAKALEYVNMVRIRASDPAGFVKTADGVAAAKYVISPYPDGAFDDKAFAINAIRFERKLELAMEGHRFFDLVRWGIAEETMNYFFSVENKYTDAYQGATFTAPQDNYFPIPQRQIDLTNGAIKQNPGY